MGVRGVCALAAGSIALVVPFQGAAAEKNDPCAAVSSTPDVRFELALRGHGATFQAGETIPLALLFTSDVGNRYSVDTPTYDRAGRVETELYCVEPEAPDPLAPYSSAGGRFGTQPLGATPFMVEADLNEWRRLGPGHYRVHAISYRVGRLDDAFNPAPNGRAREVLRSNTIELVVRPPDPDWQNEQLQRAVQALTGPSSPEEVRQAARTLRFLSTQDSTRQLARLFEGTGAQYSTAQAFLLLDRPGPQQPSGLDFRLGLLGSPYRQVAIDAMHAELSAPSHPITSEFLELLVNLRAGADPAHATGGPTSPDRWQKRVEELMMAETQALVAALPRKTDGARAATLIGLLMTRLARPVTAEAIRPVLLAAWDELPPRMQIVLLDNQWSLVAGPEMLPFLRRTAAEPQPKTGIGLTWARNAVLRRLYELDPAAGREAILRDLQDGNAEPTLKVIQLLPQADIAAAVGLAVGRIGNGTARELDYNMLDWFGDASVLAAMEDQFEHGIGQRACGQQAAMLRYFLRVAPEYGEKQADVALTPGKDTRCYGPLLMGLGERLPEIERRAIAALGDPDPNVVLDGVRVLERWGSAGAEEALWNLMERHSGPGRWPALRSKTTLDREVIRAIATGSGWICPPDKLARLSGLVRTDSQRREIERWIAQWKAGSAPIKPTWISEDSPTFEILQYRDLTEDQLLAKVAQFPRGTRLRWQFVPPGSILEAVSLATQEAVYERVRADAARHGVVVEKANHP
jgi:hypothetical protein